MMEAQQKRGAVPCTGFIARSLGHNTQYGTQSTDLQAL